MSCARVILFVAAGMFVTAIPAHADLTGFIGATTTPENRLVRGFAIGVGLLAIGGEFEYAHTTDDLESAAPALRTFMTNVLLQTPVGIHGFQPYFTAGVGIYRETLNMHSQTGFAPNTGFGVKVSLLGPLRLRVDYRAFRLGSGALYSPAHRIYTGVNVAF
jgi:hypothetical protein